MTIETRILAAKKALREANSKDQVLQLGNKCCRLMKEGNQQQVDELSTAIYTALRRFE